MNELQRVMLDAYHGDVKKYSKTDANEVIRKALIAEIGTDKIDFKTLRNNKPAIFTVIEETIDLIINQNLSTSEFFNFVEYRDIPFGDYAVFHIEDPTLLRVSNIAEGISTPLAQRIDNGFVGVNTQLKSIAIYDELNRFLAGQVDWAKLVNKVALSFNNAIAVDVYNAFSSSYNTLPALYVENGAYSEDNLIDLMDRVRANTGRDVQIWGTRSALRKIQLDSPFMLTDSAKQNIQDLGYMGVFAGAPAIMIPQLITPGTDDFAFRGDQLYILPVGDEKPVKLVTEGESIIVDRAADANTNAARRMEYVFEKRYGVSLIVQMKYGVYNLA